MPSGHDHTVYLVADDLRRSGQVWREADVEDTDLEAVILGLLEGQYEEPDPESVAFNTAENSVRGRIH